MDTVYSVLLDGMPIGTTRLEKHDAPMGVVIGALELAVPMSGYDLFRTYCMRNGIALNMDEPELRMLDTPLISDLHVLSPSGIEISGLGTTISGSDEDQWEICVFGIVYPFYAEQFPHHVRDYSGKV